MFKIGEKVVCIKYDPILISTGAYIQAPKKNDIVEINFICRNGWLCFLGYSPFYMYEYWNFKKLDYEFVKSICNMIEEDNLVELKTIKP